MDAESEKKIVLDALHKKAVGYTASESVEEYSAEDNGLRLCKKKVTSKHVPPDVSALKVLLDICGANVKEIKDMSDGELESEKQRLLALLAESERGNTNLPENPQEDI